MRWRKIGRIFDPTDHQLPGGCVEFAQSPQTLLFDDFVRIYFSTRSRDSDGGKFRSHIAFVDFRKDLRTIIRVSDRTVIPLGGLGCFDEHGIFPINVLRHGDRILGYTCGWSRRVSVSVETAIGLVESKDGGLTFERIGSGPIMAASLREPCLVGDGFVKVIDGVFHMWYIFGVGWKRYSPGSSPERVYKIGHAVSEDGVGWSKEDGRQIIEDLLGSDESQALPSVIEIDGRFHMFFCFRQSFDFRTNSQRGYRIGHAYSGDLRSWFRSDDDAFLGTDAGAWDSDMQCYPHVFSYEGNVYMLYNGNEFGRYGFGLAVLDR
jgi:hypothetical protein